MTLTRWKLMAGVLGLSMCGLAALAEPACRTVGYTARQAPEVKPQPVVEAGGKPLPPPVIVAPPTPAPLPVAPPPAATEVPPPAPAGLPPLPAPAFAEVKSLPLPKPDVAAAPPKVDLAPLPAPGPAAPPVVLDEKAFTDMAKQGLNLAPLPTLDKKPEPALPPLPKPPALELPSPLSPDAKVTTGHKLDTGAVVPTPPPAKPLLDVTPPPVSAMPVVESRMDTPAVKETKEVAVSAVVPAERKLKVQLHLGGGKPWFEVRDGDELVLKVVSDAVEVKAPAENGSAASVLKAVGGVTFRTLGGNGTCDELRVIPGTGEVVVSGRVAVTSNWGKAETTASADKMTFRLGAEATDPKR